ncbi:hypothetical protein RclHR1_00700020 [Rhizophagus clarus]|uniref:Patatin n=1 Tax=Rhizophagus clarus TaxID=94130 RepID=A0A2Z6RWM7_9GLOM|nr:hypothetical protein RclHR1_00700020 [Rhizophagus clarus]GES99827.1 patatin [Rhizophagus clarus]
MDANIEIFFSEIEVLIKFQLQKNIHDTSEVKKKFKEGKKLIDELEEDNVKLYKLFKFKYHTTYASYLKTVGEVDNAINQQNLSKGYENFESMNAYKTKPILFAKAKLNLNQVTEEKFPLEDVEEQLKNIQPILGDNILESIRQTFKLLIKTPVTFKEYEEIVNYANILNKTTDALICEGLVSLEVSPQNPETNEVKEQLKHQIKTMVEKNKNKQEFIDSLSHLKKLALDTTYLRRVNFIQHVLNSSNKKEILYSDVPFTEEELNKRSRKLASYFHPDMTNKCNTPFSLQDKHKTLGADIFKVSQESRNILLSELRVASNNEGLNFHEKKANDLWKKSIDFRNAAKGQWDKLKIFKKDEIKEFSSKELENLSVESGILAYQEYRAACKIVDKDKQLKKQVKLRGNMALCLYVSNKYLEAQLYALSAIQLQLKNSQEVTKQDLIEATNIFDKVKNVNTAETIPKLNTKINVELKSNSLALVKMIDQEISFLERKAFYVLVKNDIENLSTEWLLKPDRSLVRYQASQEEILHAKERAVKYKTAGWTTIAAGSAAGALGIYGSAAFISGVVLAPITLAAGIATFGLGVYCGADLWRKGSTLLEEPEIRENLNEIMRDALNSYDKGNYQAFFEQLSKKYDKNGTRLFKLEERADSIAPGVIIDSLLTHGFRSDGIAYLLNLLGEVLSSGKIEVKGKTGKIEKTTNELKELAKNVFAGVLSEKLKKEAEKLDNRINNLRRRRIIGLCYIVKDSVLFQEHSSIAQDMDDAQEMPFQSRLAEMCNIARINLSIFDILNGGQEELNRAKVTIREIRDSINFEHQFVGTTKSRLEALEDLLWVVSGDEQPKEPSKLSLITFPEDYIDNQYFYYLNEKLQQMISNQEKIKICNEMAVYYEKQAEKEDKINKLNSLKYWHHAQKNYGHIREIDCDNLDATLGFAKCLLKLSRYTQVVKLLDTNQDLTSSSEYMRYCSIAYCKQNNYKKANEIIVHALSLDSKNKLASKQYDILKKLEENTITSRNKRYKNNINFEKNNLVKSSNNNPIYNVLSIDGGGIRGVLPALWLSEIENRTHKSICHLFSMIAGTSTGGFVAAGLSAPDWSISGEDSPVYNYSDFKPKFSASELLKFYQQDQAKDIFSNKWGNYFTRIFSPPTYRNCYFQDKFCETKLSQALTELVIPATNKASDSTHLFTRYDAHDDSSKDVTFFEALMATTATPTFFPPHNGYIDGGMHLNNPAMAAYNEAIRYKVASERVSVLSLGTGGYIPNPLEPDKYWGQLFWQKHNHNHNTQECSTDCQMYDILGNRYQRWQVWFEEPIGFNDIHRVPYLLEIGNQYIEELDASDENPMNKLVESFCDI